MRTLPLQWDNTADGHWDLVLAPSRNWDAIDSTKTDPNGVSGEAKYCAQTVANACRMFLFDAYFFQDEGLPYFEDVLGHKPPRSLLFAYLRRAAMAVPLVRDIEIRDYAFNTGNREATGQIRITTQNGSVENVVI